VVAPELAFEPSTVFTELARRGIIIHIKVEENVTNSKSKPV